MVIVLIINKYFVHKFRRIPADDNKYKINFLFTNHGGFIVICILRSIPIAKSPYLSKLYFNIV